MFEVHRARLIIKFTASIFLICCLKRSLEAENKKKPSCFAGSYGSVAGPCGRDCQFGRQRLTALEGTVSTVHWKHGHSSKCLWVIEAKKPNSTIQLSVKKFWSTSPWYTLYIYNGSSFRAPLLAAFSGIRNKYNCTGQNPSDWIRTRSRTVLIYFFRDASNINSGFQLKYSVNNCTWSCNNHGFCYDGNKCSCDPGWTGDHCITKTCPFACVHGTCNTSTWQCDCHLSYTGHSCNISSQDASWTNHVAVNQDLIQSRIASGAGVIGNWLWIYGGLILADRPLNKIVRYSFSRNIWQIVSVSNSSIDGPSIKFGHSLIVYNKLLIIFGGITVNGTTADSLWSFNSSTRQWGRLKAIGDIPLAVTGHTANIVNNQMIVIFGYGPLGFSNKVQVYDLVTSRWKILNSTSKLGTYGHTSHYDHVTEYFYVYGGRLKGGYSGALYSYNLTANHWTYLSASKCPRFLHSSVLIGNMMLVFGGKVFNDDKITECPSTSLMVYDITCSKWNISMPKELHTTQSAGFGHSAVAYNSKLYIFGGFNGMMKNNIMSFSLGNCSLRKDRSSCNDGYSMSGCLWDPSIKKCINPEEGYSTLAEPQCQEECSAILSCGACNARGLEYCKWCDDTCKTSSHSCKESPVQKCKLTSTCKDTKCEGQLPRCQPSQKDCNKDCSKCLATTGNKKTNQMWCPLQEKCVAKDSYTAVFPNGQCNEWIDADCQALKCSDHHSCHLCLSAPTCGWCDNNSGTGKGTCMEGGAEGTYVSSYSPRKTRCDKKWYYTECPACQCNGHSICEKGNSCSKCKNHTTGRRCQKCAPGYFGDPRNGGTCQECQCNGHAKHCHHKTSKCECLVEGITGDQCERCDKERKYEGNATNGKLCYYPLKHKQRMVFNVSGKTSLNIKFTPRNTDQDVNFEIEIKSGPKAFINMSYTLGPDLSSYSKQKIIFKQKEINKKFNYKLLYRQFKFRDHDIVFQANIYKLDQHASFRIEAYFEQQSTLNINLLEFFLTFFGCFLSLLFVASVGWKIRSRYHSYLVTRQRRAERDRMANRPFATIHLLLPNDLDVLSKVSLNPVAMEPLAKNKVAVASVMVLLPVGEEGVTPVGQCGVCFGSMLMTHGNHQHTCVRSRIGHKKPKKRATMTTYHL